MLKKQTKIYVKNPKREGWLEKQSRHTKTWKRRWCVLDGLILYTFKEERLYVNPTETIDLRECNNCELSEHITGKPYSFDLYGKKEDFSFNSETQIVRRRWMKDIKAAIRGDQRESMKSLRKSKSAESCGSDELLQSAKMLGTEDDDEQPPPQGCCVIS